MSGEDRNRTFRCFVYVFEEFERYQFPSTLPPKNNPQSVSSCFRVFGVFRGSHIPCFRVFGVFRGSHIPCFRVFGVFRVFRALWATRANNTAMGWKNANLHSEMTRPLRRANAGGRHSGVCLLLCCASRRTELQREFPLHVVPPVGLASSLSSSS